MCNFYGHKVSRMEHIRLKRIEKEFGTIAALNELDIMKNGFAYGNAPILRKSAPDDFEIIAAHWEFIPPWITTVEQLEAARKQGIPWLNARSETLLTSKIFRDAALHRRCLVIASHFYEWRHFKPDGAKKEIAYPYAIEITDADYFYMAGIYNSYTNPETGKTLNSFAIITGAANEMMEVVHNKKKRQPTILTEELAWKWMMEDLEEPEIKQIASYQLPSEYMTAYTINKDFKTSANPLEPFEYEDLPPLDIAV
jgi:putative SOS response-associated peptidase YedK